MAAILLLLILVVGSAASLVLGYRDLGLAIGAVSCGLLIALAAPLVLS